MCAVRAHKGGTGARAAVTKPLQPQLLGLVQVGLSLAPLTTGENELFVVSRVSDHGLGVARNIYERLYEEESMELDRWRRYLQGGPLFGGPLRSVLRLRKKLVYLDGFGYLNRVCLSRREPLRD